MNGCEIASEFLTVKTGEIILGYPNEYGKLTERPLVAASADPGALLQDAAGPSEAGMRDLGLNGTYLVFRQLAQDVRGFWKFLEAATRDEPGGSTREARVRLASKMVGRWPSGAPLALTPEVDRPELRANNDFLYYAADPRGVRCPLGAHIRRTNPRDSLSPQPGTPRSTAVNKRHQILRRGRSYGAPVDPSMEPDALLSGGGSGPRGLHFICVNANISRQFELVQQTWVNNPKFNGLYEDLDPLIGSRGGGPVGSACFTVPADPLRQRVRGLPTFVTVRGGGYFFLPSLRALRYIAEM
jgi:Dyp-type peroxidase family